MPSHNDITGDALVSRPSSKEFTENFDKIFGKKKTNGGWKPPTDWDESRIDTIGQNGNEGLHYEENK